MLLAKYPESSYIHRSYLLDEEIPHKEAAMITAGNDGIEGGISGSILNERGVIA